MVIHMPDGRTVNYLQYIYIYTHIDGDTLTYTLSFKTPVPSGSALPAAATMAHSEPDLKAMHALTA